jgi:DNA-binding transcriptional MerR regulator
MNTSVSSETFSVVLVRGTTVRSASYLLEEAAELAELHPEMLRYYCRLGLLGEALARPGADLVFDDDALYEVRRFEHYRRHHRVDRQTLRLICTLKREVERLQADVRFLRGR